MTRWRAGWLPADAAAVTEWRSVPVEGGGHPLEVELPLLPPDRLRALARHLRVQGAGALRRTSLQERIDAIDATVQTLLDPGHPVRERMDRWLPVTTGLPADMVVEGLKRTLKTFRKHELRRFLAEDLSNPGMLDDFQPLPKGGFGQVAGPPLLAHVWAGNSPGLPLWSLVSGLLVKSAGIGKLATGEPLFAGWFVEALAEHAPAMADSLAIVWWPGTDPTCAEAVFAEADRVVAYGSDAAIAGVRAAMRPGQPLLAHGHRIGLALVGAETLDPVRVTDAAARLARDIAWHGQQACFSPQMVFVEGGGRIGPEQFAAALGQALDGMTRRYRFPSLGLEAASAVTRWRSREALLGHVTGPPDGRWSVAFHSGEPEFAPSCLSCSVRVMAVASLEEVPALLEPWRAFLQTVAIAVGPRRLFDLAASLSQVGVTRLAALGQVAALEAGWHQDGRFNLLDLVEVTEIDQSLMSWTETLGHAAD